jgi:hypothetical protein
MDLYTSIGDIFNPMNNPFFTPHYDNIEDAVIIEEIKTTTDHEE